MTDHVNPWQGMKQIDTQNLIGSIPRWMETNFPDQPAITYRGKTRTFAEFNDDCNRMANALLDAGLSPGSKFAAIGGNSYEYLVILFGCAKAGVIHVPLNPELKGDELDYHVNHSKPKGVAVQEDLIPTISDNIEGWDPVDTVVAIDLGSEQPDSKYELLSSFLERGTADEPSVTDIDEKDTVQISYTSGTTSKPKGVMLTHRGLMAEYTSFIIDGGLKSDDKSIAMMPMFHVGQMHCFSIPDLYNGAHQIVLEEFDPERVLSLIEEEGITRLFALPNMYRELASHEKFEETDLSSLELCVYAMAPMSANEVEKMMDKFNAGFETFFGQTEMHAITTVLSPEMQDDKAGSMGKPVPSVELAIMDDEGHLLDRGEKGEIVYRGAQMMKGYYKDPDKTDEAFEHGWFHSGDVGRIDEDGVLWFEDRKKDMIKTGGENVASIEVEEVLMDDPKVEEAAVVGLPHPRWSEGVTGVVKANDDDLSQDELIDYVKDQKAGFKVPKEIVVIDEFPRTATGKIQKHKIRDEYRDLFQKDS